MLIAFFRYLQNIFSSQFPYSTSYTTSYTTSYSTSYTTSYSTSYSKSLIWLPVDFSLSFDSN